MLPAYHRTFLLDGGYKIHRLRPLPPYPRCSAGLVAVADSIAGDYKTDVVVRSQSSYHHTTDSTSRLCIHLDASGHKHEESWLQDTYLIELQRNMMGPWL